MILVKPGEISFETQNDIIDYITKGIPPRKHDFELVMSRFMNPDSDTNIVDENGNKISSKSKDDVYISPMAIPTDLKSRELLEKAMERVYANRCRNRNILLGIAGISGVIGLKMIKDNHNSKKENRRKEKY